MTNILVIEDDPNILDSMVDILEAEGFEVQGVRDGRKGIQMVKDWPPDLVISDIMMPGVDGYTVLREIRGNGATATTPFIFSSARVGRDDVRKGMEIGADDYLSKPFTPTELLASVNAQLEKKQALANHYETTLNILRTNITYALPHELRTPLSSILGFAEILQMDYDEVKPEEILDMAKHILLAGKRLHKLFEKYLAYAQIDLLTLDDEQVEALRNHLTRYPAEVITQQAAQKAHDHKRLPDLTLDVCDAVLRISEANLRKIVEEVIDNAFKFSASGTAVRVACVKKAGNYIITVHDQGRGMTAEQVKSIGAYMQFERAAYEQQGLGLGLILAKRLAELHAGELTIHSEIDQGTRVQVRLPV